MKIEIKGPIINDGDQWIYDYFGYPATSPNKVNRLIDKAIQNQDSELIVNVNSGGGSVFSAAEIYTALKSFTGSVKIRIVGMAASAASVISMAGHVEMSPVAQIMIHNASTSAWGDYNDMDHTSEFLQKVNQTIINAYKKKTAKSDQELKDLMNKTTWMTAQEAKEMGFIDEIMFENQLDAVANVEHPELVAGVIPSKVLEQLRQQLKQNPIDNTQNSIPIELKNNQSVNEEEKKIMNLEQLKSEHPEIVEQIQNKAKTEAVTAERQRIQEIENIAQPGMETIINIAKFETGVSAEATAMEILKAQNAQRTNQLTNLQADAAALNEINAGEAPPIIKNAGQEVDDLLNKITGGVK